MENASFGILWVLDMQKNHNFLGLCPRPRWGAYSAPPDPLAGGEGLAAPSPRTLPPALSPSGLARVRPLSQVHTPWGKFLDKSLPTHHCWMRDAALP